MKTVILAALGANNVIGNGLTLIPPLDGDLPRFKERTKESNSLVVVGSTTFNTFPRIKGAVLPGRNIAVLTSNRGLELGEIGSRDLWTADSVESLLQKASAKGYSVLWVCGGAVVYDEFVRGGLVDEMILTMHNKSYDGDKLFPTIVAEDWVEAYKDDCFIGGYERKLVSLTNKKDLRVQVL